MSREKQIPFSISLILGPVILVMIGPTLLSDPGPSWEGPGS